MPWCLWLTWGRTVWCLSPQGNPFASGFLAPECDTLTASPQSSCRSSAPETVRRAPASWLNRQVLEAYGQNWPSSGIGERNHWKGFPRLRPGPFLRAVFARPQNRQLANFSKWTLNKSGMWILNARLTIVIVFIGFLSLRGGIWSGALQKFLLHIRMLRHHKELENLKIQIVIILIRD